MDLEAPIAVGATLLNNIVATVTGSGAANPNVVQVVDEQGNQLMNIAHDFGPTGGNVGNDISNRVTSK